jgi:Ca-activated chloride channel family protein
MFQFASPAAGRSRWPAILLGSILALAVLAGCESQQNDTASSTGTGSAVGRASSNAPVQQEAAAASSSRVRIDIAKGQVSGFVRAEPSPYPPAPPQPSTARYPDAQPNPIRSVRQEPVSTFSIDVDTASYAVARRFLRANQLPPAEAVRVEEMINYFPYAYQGPADRSAPFRAMATILPTPWNAETKLLHIGIKGFDVPRAERPRANVVLLIDVSGSMSPSDRLPLLKRAFDRFVDELREDDRLAIVTYAGASGVALEPTPGHDKAKIRAALDTLGSGGSTAGFAGLQQAYALAERHFDRNAVNRIILATDGDFNVGISDPKQLEKFVAEKRRTGIYLTVLGVGLDNLNDALMQRLAQAGNGAAAHIDSLLEARKVLGEELASTMFPIADDVKIQVEFNPALVAEYRLIGYETRMLRREDFNNDKIDAGEIGSGHSVTALYEIVPVGSRKRFLDPLRYGQETEPPRGVHGGEYAFLRLRYKLPGEEASRLIETPITERDARASLDGVSSEIRFATAVAAFGQALRDETHLNGFRWGDIAALAQSGRGDDPNGYRAEFVQLVRLAEALKRQP